MTPRGFREFEGSIAGGRGSGSGGKRGSRSGKASISTSRRSRKGVVAESSSGGLAPDAARAAAWRPRPAPGTSSGSRTAGSQGGSSFGPGTMPSKSPGCRSSPELRLWTKSGALHGKECLRTGARFSREATAPCERPLAARAVAPVCQLYHGGGGEGEPIARLDRGDYLGHAIAQACGR
jgi:hypothetical protein